jgi:hypothetical protein
LKNTDEGNDECTYHVISEELFQFEIEHLNNVVIEENGSEESNKNFGEHG